MSGPGHCLTRAEIRARVKCQSCTHTITSTCLPTHSGLTTVHDTTPVHYILELPACCCTSIFLRPELIEEAVFQDIYPILLANFLGPARGLASNCRD
ncbi:hypothetical protein E2C01_047530 [Portunus trituberculatus]|uniref:Uncharacterized protein n=1 Tax=Portunus trituberculatus TaxID=210409 RepID=A0A5B7G3V6_PORTR|nr:hypothetical protein [Portunus trituberculatus]